MGQSGRPPYKSSTNTGGSEEIMGAQAQSMESPRIDPAPLNVVRLTPPVEATLRILLNSVPYLIGAAVVRPPPLGDAVGGEGGPVPRAPPPPAFTAQPP